MKKQRQTVENMWKNKDEQEYRLWKLWQSNSIGTTEKLSAYIGWLQIQIEKIEAGTRMDFFENGESDLVWARRELEEKKQELEKERRLYQYGV